MWKVLPKSLVFKIIVYLFSIIIFIIALLSSKILGQDNFSNLHFHNILKTSILAATISLILVYIIGKWGWKPLWNMPILGVILNRHLCPDLNGEWSGEVYSSYKENGGENKITKVDVIIKADFFKFSMEFTSRNKYQTSKVVFSDLYKDTRKNNFYIAYIFESTVLNPQEFDDKNFDGAARLEIKYTDGVLTLEGLYWTNRAFQRGLNTSGHIVLTKVK
ncbi:TPA: hypothetical protein JBH38_15210 [Legionella pneumophila]|nr:hypothetical protein [Legionella pneumophila]HAU0833428.1 hypothetical protein [Legionella pneumophila]HAU0960237.1 hypothetical protein [Legionella pneumophila]